MSRASIREAITATLATLVVGLAVGPPLTFASDSNEFFGVVKAAPLQPADTQVMSLTGIGSTRFLLYWHDIQPARGTLDWRATDRVVGSLAAQGIAPVPFAYGTPRWLAPQTKVPPLGGMLRKEWKRFLVAVVRRYGPAGTYWQGGLTSPYHLEFGPFAQPKPITAWQIWNEPNFKRYWTGKPSPQGYARLVKISERAIARVDPTAKIVLAGMPVNVTPTAWRFLNMLYRVSGIRRYFDVVALHPYTANVPQFRFALRQVRQVMTRHGDGRTPLWLTEFGWGSGARSQSRLNRGLDGQGRLLSKSFRLLLDKRRSWNIARLFWFDWRDGGPGFDTGTCSFCPTAGLLTHEGIPKPAWYAYRSFAGGG